MFTKFVCHLGLAILNFENLTADSDSATPKISEFPCEIKMNNDK